MNLTITSIAVFALFAFAAAPVSAYEKGEAAPDEMTGIEVGEKAPDFTLKDQNGTEHSLSELLKEGRVALMFFRSANW